MITNGFTLTLDSGDGNAFSCMGAISGSGNVEFFMGPSYTGFKDAPLVLGGEKPNTTTGKFFVKKGRVQLEKLQGVDAISGDVIVGGQGFNDCLFWKQSDQIKDSVNITLLDAGNNGAAYLDLNGCSETAASLTMTVHNKIKTDAPDGRSGSLTVKALSIGGVHKPAGEYSTGTNSGSKAKGMWSSGLDLERSRSTHACKEFVNMSCSSRALLAVMALSVPAIGWAGEPTPPSKAEAWPKLEWKKAAPSPFARVESPTAVVDGKLYLFGGFTDDLGASNEVDVYDPANDSWTRKKDMPTRLTHLNPAIDGKTIWFAGGFQGKHPGRPARSLEIRHRLGQLDRRPAFAGTPCGRRPGRGRREAALLRRLQGRPRHECGGPLELVAGWGKGVAA